MRTIKRGVINREPFIIVRSAKIGARRHEVGRDGGRSIPIDNETKRNDAESETLVRADCFSLCVTGFLICFYQI